MNTKINTSNSATKKDFQGLRSEFRSTKKSLFGQLLKLEEKIEHGKEELSEQIKKQSEQMKKQHDEVMTLVSNFVGRVGDIEDNNEVGAEHTRELKVNVENHEKRIKKLESAKPLRN